MANLDFYVNFVTIRNSNYILMLEFQEEYDELLKYAVVVPTIDTSSLPRMLHDAKGSFLRDVMGQIGQQLTNGGTRGQASHHGSENDDDGK